MAIASTTRMSSKGQVVIPEAVRRRLGLEPGVHFVVTAQDDLVVLKAVYPPSAEECADLAALARREAAGYSQAGE